jgi:hypothetical protein
MTLKELFETFNNEIQAKKYNIEDAIKDIAAQDYVIQLTEYDNSKLDKLSFFIGLQLYRSPSGDKHYYPSTTSIERNNFKRMKIFKTSDLVLEYIKNHQESFIGYKYKIIPLKIAKRMIGDSDFKYNEYKNQQVIQRKARAKANRQRHKELKKNHEETIIKYNPGWYAVTASIGWERFDRKIEADSYQDAYNKFVSILNKDKEAKSALELYKLIPERVHMKKIKDENEEVDFSWLEWGPNFTEITDI